MKPLMQSLNSTFAWILQPALVLVLLIGGFFAASRLSMQREAPQRSESAIYAPLVQAMTVKSGSLPVTIKGNGNLEARTRIELVPQVGGEIIEIHPNLRPGGHFRADEVLARIEPRDYELAVASAEAEVSSAQTAVIVRKAESEASIAEWDKLHPGEACPPLVSQEPQIREAEARALAANAQLESARLNLARTQLSLPFDGRIVDASVDVGEVVTANQSVGRVYATDVFEIAVPLRVEELSWLDMPQTADGDPAASDALATDALTTDAFTGTPLPVDAQVARTKQPSYGSIAKIRGASIQGPLEVTGRIARVFGQLDPTSRMARAVVEVRSSDLSANQSARLLPGTFVDVEFEGRTIQNVVQLPRGALREGNLVWLVEGERLHFVQPEILRNSDGSVLVRGLPEGARVVTSNLEVATEGMQVRLLDPEQAQ